MTSNKILNKQLIPEKCIFSLDELIKELFTLNSIKTKNNCHIPESKSLESINFIITSNSNDTLNFDKITNFLKDNYNFSNIYQEINNKIKIDEVR